MWGDKILLLYGGGEKMAENKPIIRVYFAKIKEEKYDKIWDIE